MKKQNIYSEVHSADSSDKMVIYNRTKSMPTDLQVRAHTNSLVTAIENKLNIGVQKGFWPISCCQESQG